jgi:amino acid adenylation domain-containing protein/thioester reductase-like protein
MHFPGKIHHYFKLLVNKQPFAPAVITDDSVLTYAELNATSDTLALELHTRGIGAQEAIGVLVERSADLPAAFLAILKAGGVYVPMVANLPADRLANFAQQAGIRRLIVLDGIEPPAALLATLISNGAADASDAVIRPEALPADRRGCVTLSDQTGEMTDLAAILFTSGSTGTPKGVMIQHDACANMVLGHIAAHEIRPEDRILLSTSPGFILGFRELCIPFISGSAFVSVSRSTIDQPDRLLTLMGRHRVSIALFTPSYLRLLNGAVPQGLRCIVTAGERSNAADARHYARYVDYWSIYGATEACGTICMHHVASDGEGPIPGGRLFANTDVYLLDESGHEVPKGEVGEIHAVGVSIARGYVNQPELTAQSFIETRYGRAFRTHDLARWNTNGELETLGRADDVVKVSGQKVSLGEIERTLQRHPGVRRAAAFQLKGLLVACVECPAPDQVQGVDWREFLGRTLPFYMIPAQVAVLPVMPISSAGKIDRGALREIADSVLEGAREREAGTPPQGDLERAIAGVWEDVLGIRRILRENNFFAVGGTSLMAIAVSQRLQLLGHDVTVQMVLASLTVEALAARIAAQEQPTGMNDAELVEDIATADQEGFWIASKIGLAPAASHIVRILSIRGQAPQPDAWQSAWTRLIDRHAALRTAFYSEGNGPLCWRTIESNDLSSHAPLSFDRCVSLDSAREIVARWANEKFRLTEPPLVRAGLIEVDGGSETLFWFVFHHSVVDGTSARMILDDLLALLGGRPLPPTPNGMAIASRAEQQYLVSDRVALDREFWRSKLEALVGRGGKAFDEYVTERPRPALPSGRGAPPLAERLDAGTVELLGRLAKAHGAGLHAFLLAILTSEIRRRGGPGDVIVGNSISLRPAGGEAAIGHFVNVIPVVLMREGDAPFSELLRLAQSALTQTVEHAAYPASFLYREFRQRHPELRARSRTSLFDIALDAIPPRTCVDQETGITLEPRTLPGELEHAAAGLDLLFMYEPCPEDGGGLNLHLIWNPDVCSQDTAESWLSSFAGWARWLAGEPCRIERPLPSLLPDETALLERWERGPDRPRPNRRCHEIFEELADLHPHRQAIVDQNHVETFAQLDARANGIAHRLMRQRVARGTTVAVLTAGSADLPATVLGIWKAGGAYLPLAHNLPAARLAAMARDAGAEILVVLDGLTAPGPLTDLIGAIVRSEECTPTDLRARSEGSSEDVAYIIYTSGTTGMPKGVPVAHTGYVNAVLGAAETVGLSPDDRMSLAATVGFDASLWELGHGLMNGIALVPVSQVLRDDPWLLKRYYREQGVTIAFHTPSYLRISEQIPFEGLRILFTGGEAPNHRDARHHADRIAFWNCYGPTEATILVSMGRILTDYDPDVPLPVGRPLPNVRITLRREDGSLVPPGVQGELWLGGIGVAYDYLNRSDLSIERFVTTPEGRFYRSGDYGRWTPDGLIEIIGRIDDQIKLNGQRVELGEIEQTLRAHPAVVDAVVLVEELATGVKALRAFVRARDTETSEAALMEFLSERLPVHMHPASITPVAAIPLNPAGKVDRVALLKCVKRQIEALVKKAPQDQLETCVAEIWAKVLGVPVARNDNFFALGGNSLLAVTVAHLVSENLGLRVSARSIFAAPTLSEFVGIIRLLSVVEEPVGIVTETDLATEGEREFWTAEAAGLDTRTFTIPVQYLVIGDVALDRWQSAWSTLVTRHEGLRTSFAEDETGLLRRRIASDLGEAALEFAVAHNRTAALVHIRQRQADPLPMGAAPLWRAGLVEAMEDGAFFFWLALHHAIGDGQSVGILFTELTILLADGALPPPGDSGKLFASREQSYLASMESTHDAEYWIDLLKGAPAAAFDEWPLDMARSARTPSGNHRLELLLDPGTTEGLKTLARSHESSLHALMLALLAMEARRRSGRSDILIGTTASVRESTSDERIVGYSVNMLPLHLKPVEDQCFGHLLLTAQRSLAEALQHARLPFARIYRTFWGEHPDMRNPQRYPLFDIAVTENPGARQENVPRRFIRATSARGSVGYERTDASPGQDMVLIHEDLDKGGLILQLHVNAAIYSAETARNWIDALAGWARWLADDPTRAEQPLPRLLPQEEEQLAGWEQGDAIDRPRLRFHELFERMVDRPGQADCPAVVTRKGIVSYRALEKEANAIAHTLVRRGVGRGSIVAVLTGRSPNLPAAALGVWKAGATYLPLASDLPPERLAFMARDAGVSQLIALDGIAVPEPLADGLSDVLRPEDLSAKFRREHAKRAGITGKPDDVAYILYTSGSTGEPKGTLIGHDSYVNLALGASETYGLTAGDRCLMFASPSFDVSLSDIAAPLACGAAICPAPSEVVESPSRFLDFLQDLRVTVADITPTYLRLFDGAEFPPSLRILVTGGEPPVPMDVKIYAPRLHYFNAYGPTENTITSTMGILKVDGQGFLSAGRPLPNTSIYICDHDGHPLPPGVLGEIWLGGAGLSQGYLNRPELMDASFAETPRERRYRTGDLGRWHTDGTIEIVGRIDDQVKLNGIRIELGEIEHALAGHPAISQSAALLVGEDGGSKSLWAVVRPSPGQRMPTEDAWRAHLTERLPSYMIPSGVIPVPAIPLTAAGKVDRSALLALLAKRSSPPGLTPPRDNIERSVAEAWTAVLGRSPIHREDNFFALGGHSLLAIAVAHRLEKSLDREVSARELFAEPTLAGFAERLRVARSPEPIIDASSDLATVGQREFWTAEQAGLDTSGFNIPLTLAVQGDVPSAERWLAAWDALISRHDALRTGFCEDDSGVLRRVVVAQLDATLQLQVASSIDEAQTYIRDRQLEPFSMGLPGLWRAGLTQVTDSGQTIFWFIMHHAVGDGLSLGVLVEELTMLLRGEALAPPAISFNRSAASEAAYLGSETAQADAAYWQRIIGGLAERAPDAFAEWPLDKPRPSARTTASLKGRHCFRTRIDAVTADGLRILARRNGASFHALMLALLGHEVRRRTGRFEFLLGTAASTRQSAAEARTIGYFVNMLPLPCRAGEAKSIDTAVRAMQQGLADALQHSRYPFARIYDDFRRKRPQATHPARYPLFDIAVTENPSVGGSAETGVRFTGTGAPEIGDILYELRRNGPGQDLVLVHEGQPDGGLMLTWYVNAAIYTQDNAGTWFDALIGWMRFLADTPHEVGKPLPLLLPQEENLLDDLQKGPNRPMPANSFPDLFGRLADTYPERPALVTEARVQSFGEINARADDLAHALLKHDVKRGEPVAVFTERSAALPETVLAIWKAGGCYLPLTADLPAERLAFMAGDAGLRILIALDGLTLPPELGADLYKILRPEELLAGRMHHDSDEPYVAGAPITPDDLAYIIYTSGSTGVPKGVVLRHGGMLNLGLGEVELLGIKSDDRALMISSPSFDLWISDLVRTWSVGGAVVPVRREEMNDISGMPALIQRLGVTVATMSPSYLHLFERTDLPGLRILMTVGEPPIPDDARHYAAKLSYFNGYGPAENTAGAAYSRVRADAELIAAGRPLSNTAVYIVDESGNPVPPGVIGEIWLGGMGLAAGYLNRPDLTAASFVDTAGGRRYRTGDLGRWLRSGELQFLCRLDTQVKLHGQRVELGEIEHRLAAYPGVRQAVAAVETLADQAQILRSFVTLDPQTATPTQAEWSSYLSESLPSYMIPAAILRVATIPLTAAGKVDRPALLDMMDADAGFIVAAFSEAEGRALRTPPQNAIEKRVSEIWAEQLGHPLVAREDHFFELGGNSLRAIAVIGRLRREFECRVNDIYEHPVLADFASVCRPRSDHLRAVVGTLRAAWEGGLVVHAGSEAGLEDALRMQRTVYETRIRASLERDLDVRRPYRQVLLTGATGYLGSYLLRELLADRKITVTALVRGSDDRAARARLGHVLVYYFGVKAGTALRNSKRLNVLAGDLRHAELLLSPHVHSELTETVDAIYHCAANVNHIGHYRDFHADNVAATRHLLSLAAQRKPAPADFQFVSTLSVAGSASPDGFRLFTEYDFAPEAPDDNYYVRTKQEAERWVISSRGELANACIHRIGNISFATDGSRLQRNIAESAFFRQLVAFIHLGAVPVELFASLSYVDVVARAIMALSGTETLPNEIHHIETARRDLLADFIRTAYAMVERVRACDFGAFLERLRDAIDEPEMESALAETVETFGLQSGRSSLARLHRLSVASDRTQTLLERLGIVWPAIPPAGQNAMLRAAMKALHP